MNHTTIRAVESIMKEAKRNKFITSQMLRDEAVAGDIDGWMYLSAITACTFSEWTTAMFAAAFQMDAQ